MMHSKLGVIGCLLLGVAACSGSDGATGPAGAAGPPGAAGPAGPGVDGGTVEALGIVTPHVGLLARTLNVTIAGDGMSFDKTAPTFDFGAGVTVSNVQVLDSNAAIATVKIDAAAAIGPRDVKVTAGTQSFTATKGFDVEADLGITLLPGVGKTEQGGISVVSIHNRDFANALDPAFLYLTKGSSLWSQVSQSQTGTDVSLAIVFDPLATPGPQQISLANPALDGTPGLGYVADSSLITVTARSATALTSGTAKMDTLANPGDTGLYKFSNTGAAIVSINVTSANTDPIVPRIRTYGAKGTSDNFLDDQGGAGLFGSGPAATIFPVPATTDTYAIVADGSGGLGGGASGYAYTVTATATPVTNVIMSPATAHDGPANAPDETTKCVPGPCIITGKIASITQVDGYKVTLAAGATIEIMMQKDPGSQLGAVVLSTTGTSFAAGPDSVLPNRIVGITSNVGDAVNTLAPSDPAGDYYVVVFASGATQPTGGYTVAVRTL